MACEKLRECHNLKLAKETVRRLMIDARLWTPRRQRPPKIHQPRNRRSCLGELIQIDGSDHRWFEDRAPACTLLVFIDDATSRLMTLHFTATESTFSYFEATRRYIEQHGKPMALYSDRASVFSVNHSKSTADKGITQFGRALYELNVDTFCANSSQAKGRVERANLTLQDRLVKELRLRGIDTQEAANAYAPHFIADFNNRFGKYDRLSDVDQGAEIDNKRLGHILALSRQVQTERDNRRISGSPSRTNQGEPVKPKMRANNTRKQRELKQIDLNAMILRTAEMQAAAVGKLPSTEIILDLKPDIST